MSILGAGLLAGYFRGLLEQFASTLNYSRHSVSQSPGKLLGSIVATNQIQIHAPMIHLGKIGIILNSDTEQGV